MNSAGIRARLLLPLMPLVLLWPGRSLADTERFALILGNNLGHQETRKLRFAQSDARKFRQVLLELGGFPEQNVELLLEARSDQAWEALERLAAMARQVKQRRPGTRTLLVIYFSGHAEEQVLQLGRTSLPFNKLNRFIRTTQIDVRLAFIDSCMSGTLVSIKGGRHGPAYTIRVSDEMHSSGYAILTSSAPSELSQESAEIRGSYFTHYLVSALRGAGDASGDRRVTLSEAYRYVYARTVARTSDTVAGTQHPMYDWKLSGRGALVLTHTAKARSYVMLSTRKGGRVVILDGAGQRMVAEGTLKPNRDVSFMLMPGLYRAYLIRPGNRVRVAQVDLSHARGVHLDEGSFSDHRLRRAVSKGGLFSHSPDLVHRLDGGFIFRNAALRHTYFSLGAAINYRILLPGGWQPLVRVCWTTTPKSGQTDGYWDLGLAAGFGRVWLFRPLNFRLEALLGYEHLVQRADNGEQQDTSGFNYLGRAGIEIARGSFVASSSIAIGGRVFQVQQEGWVNRPDLQLYLGLGWKWGD